MSNTEEVSKKETLPPSGKGSSATTCSVSDFNNALLALKDFVIFAEHPDISKHIDGACDPDVAIYRARKVLDVNWKGWDEE